MIPGAWGTKLATLSNASLSTLAASLLHRQPSGCLHQVMVTWAAWRQWGRAMQATHMGLPCRAAGHVAHGTAHDIRALTLPAWGTPSGMAMQSATAEDAHATAAAHMLRCMAADHSQRHSMCPSGVCSIRDAAQNMPVAHGGIHGVPAWRARQLMAFHGAANSMHAVAPAWAHVRHMATSRGSAHDARVNPSLLRGLPFIVTPQQAEQQFWQYVQSNPFLASPTPFKEVKETFVPFWLVQLGVEARATQAQIGHRQAVRRMNPATRRMELTWETQWTVVHAPYQMQSVYPPERQDMQVCGTTKYMESDMDILRPGDLVARPGLVRSITAPGMLTEERRVVPFSVRPAEARARALAWVRAQERLVAEEYYRRTFTAEEVRFVDLEVSVTFQAAHPVYIPVYVYSRPLPGLPGPLQQLITGVMPGTRMDKLHTFVSGVSEGVVAGSQVWDPVKVGAAAGVLGPTLLLATGLASLLTPLRFLVLGVLLPVMGAAALARHAPHLRKVAESARISARRVLPRAAQSAVRGVLGERLSGLLGMAHAHEEEAHGPQERGAEGKAGAERMEDPWVRPYEGQGSYQSSSSYSSSSSGYERTQSSHRQSAWGSGSSSSWSGRAGQQQGQGGARPSGATRGDPKGYYALLGLKPGARASEVQEAFRTRALQQHPDRFPDPADKASATAAFQRLSEAYGVLRNPTKRAAYDAGLG